MYKAYLAGPTRREWGKFHPQYTNVKVEGPSFPKGQPVITPFITIGSEGPTLLGFTVTSFGNGGGTRWGEIRKLTTHGHSEIVQTCDLIWKVLKLLNILVKQCIWRNSSPFFWSFRVFQSPRWSWFFFRLGNHLANLYFPLLPKRGFGIVFGNSLDSKPFMKPIREASRSDCRRCCLTSIRCNKMSL